MTQPGKPGASPGDAAGGVPGGRFRSLGAQPAPAAVTGLLAAAFIVRGAISLSDALSVATDGLRPIPVIGPIAFSAISPLWSVLWAVLAIVAGLGLALRWRAGWLVGSAVAVAYLVSGIADLSLLDWSHDSTLKAERLVVVVVDLLVPATALFLLSWTRGSIARPRALQRGTWDSMGPRRRDGPGHGRRDAHGLARRAGSAFTMARRSPSREREARTESTLDRWRRRT